MSGCVSSESQPSDPSAHPIVVDASGSPSLGPSLDDARAIMVAFEDPSCRSCAKFATESFPELRADAIDTGDLAYLWRPLPWVQAWSDAAINALFAVHERDREAFWRLKDRFYATQGQIDSQNVETKTREFLEELAIDTSEVLTAVRERRFAEQIATSEDLADRADISTVPSFVLIRADGSTTKVSGPHSPDVFLNALEL